MKTIRIVIIFLFLINIPAYCGFKDKLSDLLKSNSISQNDRGKYRIELGVYDKNIANAVSSIIYDNKGSGKWAAAEFDKIKVTPKLSAKFTRQALIAEFNKFNFDETRENMERIRENASWSYDQYGELKYEIHNYHQIYWIEEIIIEICVDGLPIGTYTLESNYMEVRLALPPNKDGKFSTRLNNNTINKLNSTRNRTARISKIVYVHPESND